MSKTILVGIADGHTNSRTGLYNPKTKVAQRRPWDPLPAQLKMWECYVSFWKRVASLKRKERCPVRGVFAGDWGDLNTHAGTGLISVNKFEALTIANYTLEIPLAVCDTTFMLYGTEAHGGDGGWLEDAIAEKAKAEPDINKGTNCWMSLNATLSGIRLTAAHHPKARSSIPWTREQMAARESAIIAARYYRLGLQPPDVAFRAHLHTRASSGITSKPLTFYLPPWQLCTMFGARIGEDDSFEPFGGVILVLEDGAIKSAEMLAYEPERGKEWVDKEWSEKKLLEAESPQTKPGPLSPQPSESPM
jgi:hypothetical protein